MRGDGRLVFMSGRKRLLILANFGEFVSHFVFTLCLSDSPVSLWVRARKLIHKKASREKTKEDCHQTGQPQTQCQIFSNIMQVLV